MKIYISKIKENEPNGISLIESKLNFSVNKPMIIQPSEVMKVSINAVIKIVGNVVLSISTHPDLAEKVGELFPGIIILDSVSKEIPLILPVRNIGRNPINLMTNNLIAIGHLIPVENIELGEFSIAVKDTSRKKSRPGKRNADIKFELS